ncbi:sugar phosphate isomerase/epimerase family protein [Dactylosporangium sp. NPDC051541]|uniref:sugar phosphate isomerase/epimerase family protein n=1 Tax=Dactylosporangium sp. NPDC051541 TaxID=3363977 RepID=UPI00378A52F7
MELLSRRNVLGAAAGAATLATVGAAAPASAHEDSRAALHRVPRERISVQLYTLRDQLNVDLAGSLATLARIGYTRIEHAGFVGRTATQFRAALDAAGIKATSGHVAIPQPFDANVWEQALHDANVVGNTYIVHPFFGVDAAGQPIRDGNVYRAMARDLNRAGTLARRAGIDFGYHNHNLEFTRQDGGSRTGYDILTAETDPRLVHLEVDLFWAWVGAQDPVDLIAKHRGRIRQVHVKDLNTARSFEDAGSGLIDFGRIFQHAREAGIAEFIIERDDAGTPPRTPADALTTARNGFQYLDTLRF